MKKILRAILVFQILVAFAFAQTGVIVSGTTEDQTGAVIPGQAVSLTRKADSQALKVHSDGAGRFTFSNVAPGDYVLKAKGQGFKPVQKEIKVGNQSLTSLALTMPILDAEEVIEVKASKSQSAAADNNVNAVQVNADLINSLPLQGEDVLPLVTSFLSPAAQGPDGPSIVVDGVEGTDLDLPADSLKHIQINKNPYSPEFRRPGLGRIEVTTKHGSRGHFDGSFASSFRNDALDATNAFADQKPPLDRRLFQTTFGGPFPIRHARFFVSASRLMDNESAIVSATTPQGPFVQNVPTHQTTTNLFGKLDLRPDPARNTISLIYSFHSQPNTDRGVGGLFLPSHQSSRDDRKNKGQILYSELISPALLNVAAFKFEVHEKRDGIFPTSPEIDVKGAFVGGSDQNAERVSERKIEIQDVLSYTHGVHTWRFGAGFRPNHFSVDDATNFGGTFTFSSLDRFQAGNPELFEIVQGNPKLEFSQNEAYAFVQDETRLGPHVDLMLGARYDWQQHLKDYNNIAPRAALAFSPGAGNTVFRFGGGLFYDHLSDSVTEQTGLLNGTNAREFVLSDSNVGQLVSLNPSLAGVPPSLWVLAPDIQAPYLIQVSAGIDHGFGPLRASVEYQYLRGVHLLRARDINTPVPGVGRPNPDLFLVRQVESTASLRSNSLNTSLQGRILKRLKFKAQYTLSKSEDDTDGPFALPASSLDLAAEWGRSLFDMRHRFTFAGYSDLPHGFRLGAIFSVHSGAPFNITTGADTNGDGVVNDRPAGVLRNSGNGFAFSQLDLRLSKTLYIAGSEKTGNEDSTPDFTRVELSIDAFNVLNQANFNDVVGVITSPRFGQPTAAFQPRTIQLSAKFVFRSNRE